MAHIVFYEKPGCGGNNRQKQALSDSGHAVEARSLLTHPWTAEELRAFFGPRPVQDWFNRSHPKVKSGEIDPAAFSAEQALALMLAEPLFIRRPLLQVGDRREAGWDEEMVRAWIGLGGGGVSEGCPKGETHTPCPPPASTRP